MQSWFNIQKNQCDPPYQQTKEKLYDHFKKAFAKSNTHSWVFLETRKLEIEINYLIDKSNCKKIKIKIPQLTLYLMVKNIALPQKCLSSPLLFDIVLAIATGEKKYIKDI